MFCVQRVCWAGTCRSVHQHFVDVRTNYVQIFQTRAASRKNLMDGPTRGSATTSRYFCVSCGLEKYGSLWIKIKDRQRNFDGNINAVNTEHLASSAARRNTGFTHNPRRRICAAAASWRLSIRYGYFFYLFAQNGQTFVITDHSVHQLPWHGPPQFKIRATSLHLTQSSL